MVLSSSGLWLNNTPYKIIGNFHTKRLHRKQCNRLIQTSIVHYSFHDFLSNIWQSSHTQTHTLHAITMTSAPINNSMVPCHFIAISSVILAQSQAMIRHMISLWSMWNHLLSSKYVCCCWLWTKGILNRSTEYAQFEVQSSDVITRSNLWYYIHHCNDSNRT